MVEGDLDDLGLRLHIAQRGFQGARQIDPVEAEDHIGVADRGEGLWRCARTGRASVERMVGRESRAHLGVGDDAGAQLFGQRDALRPGFLLAGDAARHDEGTLRAQQDLHRRAGLRRIDVLGDLGHVARGIDGGQWFGDALLLNLHIQHHIGRRLGGGVGEPGGAQDGFARGAHRRGLIVPLHVMADHGGLIAGGVDPFDPGAALDGVDDAGRAQDDHGHAVAPGVEDRHGGVHQAHIGMDGGGHGLAGDLGVALRDGDGVLLMQAQQHLGVLVAQIVHDAVMQAPIARARIERDIGDVEGLQGFRNDVAAEDRARLGGSIGLLEPRRERAEADGCVRTRCFGAAHQILPECRLPGPAITHPPACGDS